MCIAEKVLGPYLVITQSKSKKPLWVSEFGVDAWTVTNATGINNWGS